MGYSFWTPPIEQRQYVDVGNFFAGIGAGQAEQQGKARNALLEAEIGQMPTRNALLQEQLAGAQTTNESNRMEILKARQAEFARKLSEDDPGTIREQIEEGLSSGVIQKPPSIGGVPFDKWNPDQYKKYARAAKMEGLSIEKQIEMKQPGYGLEGEAKNYAALGPVKFSEYKTATRGLSPYGPEAQAFEQFKAGLKPDQPSRYGPEAMAFEEYKSKLGTEYKETSAQRAEREKEVARFKSELDAKYKDTPEGSFAKQKELEQFKAGLKTEKGTALEEKTQTIIEAYPGMDDKTAKRIATGTLKVVTDPYTGNVALVDVGTGEQVPMSMRGEKPTEKVPVEKKAEETLWEMADLSTGPWSAMRAGAGTVSGMVGLPTAEKTDYARQYIRSAQNDLIRALSINPRFPVGEINRLKEEINISPKLLDNPDKLKTRMKAVDNYLKRRLEKEQSTSNDTNAPMNDRKAAATAAKDIGSFIKLLGVPEGSGGLPTVKGIADYQAISKGQKYIDPDGNVRTKQ